MLISAVLSIKSLYRLPHGQYGYSGHVINLPQDVASFVNSLPRLPSNLDVIIVRREGSAQSHRDFRVRRSVVLGALQWLIQNNKYYRSVTIDSDALALLPEDGNISGLCAVTLDTADEEEQLEAPVAQDEDPVTNCQTKLLGQDLEIVAYERSKVTNSPRKIQVPEGMTRKTAKPVQLENVEDVSVNQKVTVIIKVFKLSEPDKVTNTQNKELRKQECMVGDASSSCRVVLWEDDVGSLVEDKSYGLNDATVRSYNGINYLSMRSKSTITPIDDIGYIVQEIPNEEGGIASITVEGEIDAVLSCDNYTACLACNSKIVSENVKLGRCSKCGIMLKVAKCNNQYTARVIVSGESDGKSHTLTMFNEVLRTIAGYIEDYDASTTMSEKLLLAPLLHFNVSNKGIVYSVKLITCKQLKVLIHTFKLKCTTL